MYTCLCPGQAKIAYLGAFEQLFLKYLVYDFMGYDSMGYGTSVLVKFLENGSTFFTQRCFVLNQFLRSIKCYTYCCEPTTGVGLGIGSSEMVSIQYFFSYISGMVQLFTHTFFHKVVSKGHLKKSGVCLLASPETHQVPLGWGGG